MLVTLDRASNQAKLKQVLGKKDFARYKKNPIGILEDISMLGEIPTRIGVHKRAAKKTSDIEAGYESREAPIDFHRRGARTKVYSSLTTFLNANVQVKDKMLRTMRERPVEFLAKAISVGTIPSVINYLVNRDDPMYWQIEEWQRDMFWCVKIGGRYWRIPKGDVGVLFGTTTERIMEFMDSQRDTKKEVDKLALNVIKEMMPLSDIGGYMPVAARLPAELLSGDEGYSFFLRRGIVPVSQKDIAASEQYGRYTTETAKAVGKKLGVAPRKVEHFARGIGGGLAKHALDLADWMLGEMGVVEKKPPRPIDVADIPGVKAVAIRDPHGFNSESANRFYEVSEKLGEYKKTLKNIQERKGQEAGRKWAKDNPVEADAVKRGIYTQFNSVRKKLSSIRKEEDRIWRNTTYSKDEKRKRLGRQAENVMKLIMPLLARYRALEKIHE